MKMISKLKIGDEVIRLDSSYDEKGEIREIDGNRARVLWTNQWGQSKRTWYSLGRLGLTSEWKLAEVTIIPRKNSRHYKGYNKPVVVKKVVPR